MIVLSAASCIIACAGDIGAQFAFGTFFPGYNQLKDTVSRLGSSISPVSAEISQWWIILGVLFIFFGIGFYKAFQKQERYAKLASVIIVIYGIGEGFGSGAFKADHDANGLTASGIYHEILGGIGVIAILLLPLVMRKVITRNENPAFYRLSQIIFISGLFFTLLFLFRYLPDVNNFFSIYKGLWQRLFILNTYVYFLSIAFYMIRKQKSV